MSGLAVVPLAELFQRLHSTETGLKAADAAAVLETAGPNQIAAVKHASLAADFLGRFSNPLVLILLFAAAVSAFTGDVPSFVIIATIVLMSVILDVAQERQAQNAAERLRAQVSLSARALRDGKPVDIPAAEIVPGDVVLLAAGDLVPADSRLIRIPRSLRRRSASHRRGVPGRKERCAADRRGRARNRVPARSRVHGKLGGERNRESPGRGDRARGAARLDRQRVAEAAAADRLRNGHPEVRDDDRQGHDLSRPVRGPGQHPVPSAAARILPVRAGARRRTDA